MADSFVRPPSPMGNVGMDSPSPTTSTVLTKLRSLVQTYISLDQFTSALYWADKLATLSLSTASDMHLLAHCLLLTKQYHRASHLVVASKLHFTHLGCCYVAARALHLAGEHEEALAVLEEGEELVKEEENEDPEKPKLQIFERKKKVSLKKIGNVTPVNKRHGSKLKQEQNQISNNLF